MNQTERRFAFATKPDTQSERHEKRMRESTKFCGGCCQHKPLAAFSKHRYMKDGRQTQCRQCSKVYAVNYRRTHPGKNR